MTAVQGIAGIDVEAIEIAAQADLGTQLIAPVDAGFREESAAGLLHGILPDGVQHGARLGVIQADRADVIVPDLQADAMLDRPAEPALEPAMRDAAAEDPAAIDLFKL